MVLFYFLSLFFKQTPTAISIKIENIHLENIGSPIEIEVSYKNIGNKDLYFIEPKDVSRLDLWIDIVGFNSCARTYGSFSTVTPAMYAEMIRYLKSGDKFSNVIKFNDIAALGGRPALSFRLPGFYAIMAEYSQDLKMNDIRDDLLIYGYKKYLDIDLFRGHVFSQWVFIEIKDAPNSEKLRMFENLKRAMVDKDDWALNVRNLSYFTFVRYGPANDFAISMLNEIQCNDSPYTSYLIEILRNFGSERGFLSVRNLVKCKAYSGSIEKILEDWPSFSSVEQ